MLQSQARAPHYIFVNLCAPWIQFDIVVAHAPHSWDPRKHKGTQHDGIEVEDAEAQAVKCWEHLSATLAKRPLPHRPLVLLADVNIEVSHAQVCYKGLGDHQVAKEATPYAGIFAEFIEAHQLALPSIFRSCHKGPRRIFAGNFSQRRIDFVGVPYTWLDGVTPSRVFDQFDILSARDHYPLFVLVKGYIVSNETMPSSPRLDARWICKRDPIELNAAFGALARTSLLAWHFDVHAHRAALTQIVR